MTHPFLDLLSSGQRFVLSGHEHPDGDCVGTQIAVCHLIEALGGSATILNPDPVPRNLRFLTAKTPVENFRDTGSFPACDTLLLLDCAQVSRLGEMASAAREGAGQIAVVDHHVGSDRGDGDLHFVDVTAAASGVLAYDLFRLAGVPLTPVVAEAIFVAIVADTGWFRYSNTDRRTLEIAAELIEVGVQPDVVYDRLHRDLDPSAVELLALGLATHAYRLDGRFAFAALDRSLMSRTAQAGFDTDLVLEPLRSVAGVEVAALFKAHPSGVKVSLRSMGDADVQVIARGFGGGGHVKASGATLSMKMSAAIEAVTAAVAGSLRRSDGPGGEALGS